MAETTTVSESVEWERHRPHPFDSLGIVAAEAVHSLSKVWRAGPESAPLRTAEPTIDDVLWAPHLDMVEDSTGLIVSVILPGITKKDVGVALEQGHLVIRAERKPRDGSSEDESTQTECRFGSFDESLPIPFDVRAEEIEVSLGDGILTILLPKAECRVGSKSRQ
jgi:HSP20 family molecular chaperone IbpA